MNDLVYVLGPSYSGSTLLTLLLGRQPAIATVGELKHLVGGVAGEYRCSCGVDIHQCRFWSRVKEGVEARGAAFDIDDWGVRFGWPQRRWLHRALRARVRGAAFETLREGVVALAPGCRERLDHIARRNQLLIEVIAELMGGQVFVDSSKDPARLHWLLRARLWNVRVIHLARDGRGTAFSAMRRDRIPMRLAATEVRKTHDECQRLVSRLGATSSMSLRYEDLCRDPRAALERVLDFLGLPSEAAELDFRAAEHHVLGNEMRLLPDSEIRLDERWKSGLAATDLATFERIAGGTNRALGYA